MTTLEMHRLATFNFRDLGGLPAADGRVLRHGEIYRSDGLHRLREDDLERLAAAGLRTVLDLRTLAELTSAPSVSHPGFDVVHLPVIERTWSDDGRDLSAVSDAVEFLAARYGEMLSEGGPALSAAVHVLAAPARRPAVFHCAAGKDRTGVLAALVLDVVGVAPAVIADDYGRSAAAMARMIQWLETERPEVSEVMARQPAAMLACPPEAMRRFLDHLHDDHGGAAGYLRGHGVPAEALRSLRDQLLEPIA